MSTTSTTNHPPDTRRLDAARIETALPRLRPYERFALRIAMRALLRIERSQTDRERLARMHEHAVRARELALAAERSRTAIGVTWTTLRPPR